MSNVLPLESKLKSSTSLERTSIVDSYYWVVSDIIKQSERY